MAKHSPIDFTVNPRYGFSEVTVETWPEAKALLRTFPVSWIFRGQGCAEWFLSTSIERNASPFAPMFEGVVTASFQTQAHNYLAGQQLPASTLEWWALMQHHGAPTRLLDFTDSAYVAAFFALDEAGDRDCAIWAIDRVWCRNSAARAVGKVAGGRVEVEQIERLFDSIFAANKVPFAFPIRPERFNTRLAVQQGLFLCPGSVAQPFMDNLSEMDRPDEYQHRVVRITLRRAMRANALHDLNYMNINRATLFPGLDGFAASLRNQIVFLRDIGDPVDDLAMVNGFPFAPMADDESAESAESAESTESTQKADAQAE